MKEKHKIEMTKEEISFPQNHATTKEESTNKTFIPVLPTNLIALLTVVLLLTGLYIGGLFYIENTVYYLVIKLVSILLMGMFWIDIYWRWKWSEKTGVYLEKEKLRDNTGWGELNIDWKNITKASIDTSILDKPIISLEVNNQKAIFEQASFVQKLGFYVSKWYNGRFFVIKTEELDIEEEEFLELLNKKLDSK